MKVYLVEDVKNSPGKIYAIFANLDDAKCHAIATEDLLITECTVIERTLHYGQVDAGTQK